MRILYQYLAKELVGPFLVGLGFFTFVFILNPILQLVDLLIVKRAPLPDVLLLFVYYLPCTIAITLPMAALVAVLMAYGRLSSDSEIIAMRASGTSYLNIFLPAIIFSILISILGVYFNDTLLPKGNFACNKLQKEIIQRKPLTILSEHVLTNIGDSKVIGVDRIDKENNLMYGVVIFEGQNQTGTIRQIIAKTGRWLDSLEQKVSESKTLIINRLLLENGHVQEPVKGNIENFSDIPFDKLIVNITDEINYDVTVYKGAREETTSEIAKEIKENELKSKTRDRQLRIEYHKRFSIPFAALGFVLIGLPFSIVSGRSGKSISMGISVVLIIIYYLFYALGEGIGKNTQVNEALALWIPNIIFFIVGAFYIHRISRT